MNKCLNCDKELTHVEGRRKKSYCNTTCKSQFWNKKQGKGYKPKTKRISPERFAELLKIEEEMRNSPLINAARGRDSSGINEDEAGRLHEKMDDLEDKQAALYKKATGKDAKWAKKRQNTPIPANDANSEEKGSVGAENASRKMNLDKYHKVVANTPREVREEVNRKMDAGEPIGGLVGVIPPMPVREDGEDAFVYAARKNEWKRKYNQ